MRSKIIRLLGLALLPVALFLFLLLAKTTVARMSMDMGFQLGAPSAGGGGPAGDALLLESGDYVLLESGDYLLLE